MNDKSADMVFGSWFPADGDPDRNPVNLARAAMRAPLAERFYKDVDFIEEDGLFAIRLDGRKARTPSKNLLALPNAAAASVVAAEWEAQRGVIDPSEMHATRIANSAIDHVVNAMPAVAGEIAGYAGSDLICYRAAEPPKLVERQRLVWDPLVDWARAEFGVRLVLTEGVMHIAQAPEAIERLQSLVRDIGDPLVLSALHVVTTLSGSLVIALAVMRRELDPAAAYNASDLEADFAIEVWGEDEEAAHRRARRKREFDAAAKLLLSGAAS